MNNQCVWSKINHESTVLTWPAGGIRLFVPFVWEQRGVIAAVADQTAMISHLLPMCWATRGRSWGHVMMWVRFGSQGSIALNWHSRYSGTRYSGTWLYFDLVKRVKFGVSGHFLENAWREWPEIWYAAVSWPHSELIRLWLRSGDFSNFGAIFDLVKRVKFWVSRHFLKNPWRKWPEILLADVSWPLSELIRLLLQFVDFFLILMLFWLSEWLKFGVSRHFGRALWIFLIIVTLWLKLVIFGVSGHYLENMWKSVSRGGWRHISDALRRVLSSLIPFFLKLTVACRLCVIYVREDEDSNV